MRSWCQLDLDLQFLLHRYRGKINPHDTKDQTCNVYHYNKCSFTIIHHPQKTLSPRMTLFMVENRWSRCHTLTRFLGKILMLGRPLVITYRCKKSYQEIPDDSTEVEQDNALWEDLDNLNASIAVILPMTVSTIHRHGRWGCFLGKLSEEESCILWSSKPSGRSFTWQRKKRSLLPLCTIYRTQNGSECWSEPQPRDHLTH